MCSTPEVRLAMLRAAIDEVALAMRGSQAGGGSQIGGGSQAGNGNRAGSGSGAQCGGRTGDGDQSWHGGRTGDHGRAEDGGRTGSGSQAGGGQAGGGGGAAHADGTLSIGGTWSADEVLQGGRAGPIDPGELAKRLAGLWAMMAALDPALAARLPGYGPDDGLCARTARPNPYRDHVGQCRAPGSACPGRRIGADPR